MEIVRYIDRLEHTVRVGLRQQERVQPIAVPELSDLWSKTTSELPATLSAFAGESQAIDDVILLPPVDGRTEVWAAGLTYERARPAREDETLVARAHDLVYEASRPEIFFKSVAWRVVTDNEPVGIRGDSELNVPEAELALVINAHGEIVGYTVCNDMNARTIEGENPLYLPQAELYAGSCALATGIRPAWEVPHPESLGIALTVTRAGTTAWHGTTNTSAMRRQFDELVGWVFAAESYPAGVILSTGTGLVPEMDFRLEPGDVVRIVIDQIGTLTNTVLSGKESFQWLTAPVTDLIAAGTARYNPDLSEPSPGRDAAPADP
jgi:2-dehydro-3-deoxy-D-arabinonate dehydratase